MRKAILLAVVATGSAVLVVAFPIAARANAPERFTFDQGFVDSIDAETCAGYGFDLEVVEHEYGTFSLTFDAEGNFVGGRAQIHYDAWIRANGKTLVERDLWNNTLLPDGSVVQRGLTVHIAGPDGGIVLRDAGRLMIDPDDNIVVMNGPHLQLNGVTFCPALET
jgi:hypothetical protein